MSNINDKLFLRVLQIGRDNIQNGVKFSDLTQQLKREGYAINNCTNRTLREWFYSSFFHEEAHCSKDTPASYTNVSNLDEHKQCSFILKGDSCMKLLQYEVSDTSNRQVDLLQKQRDTLQAQITIAERNASDAKSESAFAKRLAIAAIILSAVCSAPDWITLSTSKHEQSNSTLVVKLEQQQLLEQQRISRSVDTMISNLDDYLLEHKVDKHITTQ